MFAPTTLLLLLGNCAATAPVGALCIVDPEESVAMAPSGSLRSNLNLLQVDLSMLREDSAPERDLIEYHTRGLKATADTNTEVLGLLSEDLKDLDQMLPREESLLTAASLLDATDSILTAAFADKLTISTAPPPTVDEDPSQRTMIFGVVGVVLLLACCFPMWGCLKMNCKGEAKDFLKKPPVMHGTAEEEAPLEVWTRKQGSRKRSCKLEQLFDDIAEVTLSDESPPGYFNGPDLAVAIEDPEIKQKMISLGLDVNNCDTMLKKFRRGSTASHGLVGMQAFIEESLEMGAQQD